MMEDVETDYLVESENVNVEYNNNVVEDETLDRDGTTVPEVGMKFKDENEVFNFYKVYAYEVGFSVRKRNSRKDDDGVLRYVTFTCSREGRRNGSTSGSLKPLPTIQTGCRARISASLDIHGYWKINTVHLDHNHKTSPTKSRLYRCNRELSTHMKRQLEVNDMAGIPLHKSYNSAVVEAGGYENLTYIENDCRNYIEQVRRLSLGEGDAAALHSYFSDMQARSAGFYFCLDVDDDSRLRNVFCADGRCREAYKEFRDVVTFDTTYLTNIYDMPFAPFVGVNHHGQSTLLDCGLVSNENTDTFVWLFRTWMKCMHGQAPHGIITDQDRAMQNVIQIVFPNTKHRWCLWHILKKLPEKFGYHVNKRAIFSAIHVLVYDCQTVENFEQGWGSMLATFDLHENDWLTGLYENRGRWVPCFLKTSFWAGMSTTQRSESINAFFDGYIHSKTSLKQFVEQYERALRNKVEKEFQADFKSFSQMVLCATTYNLEKQFQAVYTISKFKEVPAEFAGKVYCDLISVSEGCFGTTYEVREDVVCNDQCKTKTFSVSFNSDKCEVVCSCHLFEFRGIICRHAIAVLIRNDVKELPDRYILRRWRRDVSRPYTRIATNYADLASTPGQLRYDNMCQAFAEVADLAADDEERTRFIMEWIQVQSKELSMTKLSSGSNICGQRISNLGSQGTGSQYTKALTVLDPKSTKRKGAPRKLRRKSPLETTSTKKKGQMTRKGKRPTGMHSIVPVDQLVVDASQREEPSTCSPFAYSQLLMGNEESNLFTQPLEAANLISSSSAHFILNSKGHATPYSINM